MPCRVRWGEWTENMESYWKGATEDRPRENGSEELAFKLPLKTRQGFPVNQRPVCLLHNAAFVFPYLGYLDGVSQKIKETLLSQLWDQNRRPVILASLFLQNQGLGSGESPLLPLNPTKVHRPTTQFFLCPITARLAEIWSTKYFSFLISRHILTSCNDLN